MRIIAFAGPKSCGKDTAARYLLARNSLLKNQLFRQLNFAETLKLTLELMFGYTPAELNDAALKEVMIDRWPAKTPRDIMQNFANLMRTMYAQDIFVRAWVRKAMLLGSDKNCILVTDLRHPEELEKLRELGAKIIYVDNPKVEAERVAGRAAGDPLWSDSSEAFSDLMRQEADAVVYNDGEGFQRLYDHVHQAVLQLYGDWKDWQELAAPDPFQPQSPTIL
ncbi:deoxynucleotide monophosphate kinase [Brevundimonas phage vB_BpoS-StAshley]|nr:deoxynucleotide monophosphate kinase [Brevundimonas phage vB_BpoS-StAshley]